MVRDIDELTNLKVLIILIQSILMGIGWIAVLYYGLNYLM